MGNASLTFENCITLLAQIEAVLTSRPLVSLSPSPNDMDILTPSHFLIARRLTSLPDSDISDIEFIDCQGSSISRCYVNTSGIGGSKSTLLNFKLEASGRQTWIISKLDNFVLVKDNNLPPLNWRLGIITAMFPRIDKNLGNYLDLQLDTN